MRRVLFFYAPWCRPCRFYESEFIKPLVEMVDRGKVVSVNAQDEPFTADKYLVDKLPTVIFLDGNKAVNRVTGALDIKGTAEWLKGGV